MNITKEGNRVVVEIEGKLDRNSSPGFDSDMASIVDDSVSEIVLDMGRTIYVSSAGLRAILSLEKKMESVDGVMHIINIPQMVMEVFVETGLSEILTLE